jgi:hypothetical protein
LGLENPEVTQEHTRNHPQKPLKSVLNKMKIELLMFCFRDISLRLQSISLLATCIEAVEAVRLMLVSIRK